MMIRHIPGLLLICALALILAACTPTPEPTPTPTSEPTATEAPVVEAPTPTVEASSSEATPTAEEEMLAPELPSEAELAKQRKPAIDHALTLIDLPEEGDLVATVNGKGIPLSEYREFLRLRLDSLASQYQIDWAMEDIEPVLRDVESQALEQLIEFELMAQEAEALDVSVDEVEVDEFMRDVQESIIESGGFATWEEYQETLELSDEGFERIIRQSLLTQKMMERQSADMETEVEQVHARHILVSDEALAQEILDKLAEGDDFGGLATAFSEDAHSAQQAGDLGWFPRGVMVPAFEEAAFALEPGETSPIVASDYGFHIIQVLDKGRQELDPYYLAQFQQQAFVEWLDTVRAEAEIERYILEPLG
jgi:foldase protein PrsA